MKNWTTRITTAALALIIGVLGTVLTSAETASAAAVGTRVYQYPADQLEASRACYRQEREALGIPGEMGAYVAWWNAHEGTAVRVAWSAAYEACQDRYLTVAPFDWGRLVLVGTR